MKENPDWFTVLKPGGHATAENVQFGDWVKLYSNGQKRKGYLTIDPVTADVGEYDSVEIISIKTHDDEAQGSMWKILKADDFTSKAIVNFGDKIVFENTVNHVKHHLSCGFNMTHPGLSIPRVIIREEHGAKEKWKVVKASLPFDELDLGVILNPVPGAVPSLPSGFTAQQIVIGAISAVPKIGAVVGAVVKLFWKEDTVDVWDQVKTRVHEAITHEMSEARMSYLNTWLAAARKNFKQYIKLKNPEEKGNYLTYVLADLNHFKLEVGNPKNPADALYCLVGTAVLHITALRERYVFGEELYGKEDEDKKTAHEDLLENIAYYQDLAKRVRENIITKRKSHISYKKGPFGMVTGWFFRDTYTGEIEHCGNAAEAETKYNEHINFHISRLTEKIDDLLAPIKVFPYMDPENDNMPIKVGKYWQ
jgi:hypothetical protein